MGVVFFPPCWVTASTRTFHPEEEEALLDNLLATTYPQESPQRRNAIRKHMFDHKKLPKPATVLSGRVTSGAQSIPTCACVLLRSKAAPNFALTCALLMWYVLLNHVDL